MSQLARGLPAERTGAAPSSVSIAVLCVALLASVPLWSGRLAAPEESVGLTLALVLVAGAPLLWALSGLVTLVYVLPLVAMAHRFGRRSGRGERRRYVWAATLLGLLPAAVLPTLVLMVRAGTGEWLQLAAKGASAAAALWIATAPAVLAVHLTLGRERTGRPVRPVVDILLWGTLGLCVEYAGWLVLT
ncbi:hypothetical protein [Streptomyces sp. CB02460]|uniref:hypothetical protein n=1 Tax=Streptomyces sp. CB02460 TaxID=1703941 RepID=UPI00093F743B|nr:hypothetical protein [Streptomyces sp. CB02460]OKJ68572.1 hypothetical protein AMK30_29385 [Streptomyces sp. CB02460]